MQKQKLANGRCQYRSRLLQGYASVGIALLAPLLLSWIGVTTLIDTQLSPLGFDVERASLLTSLLLAFLSSLCAAFFLQRCGPAWLGGLILFVLRSLFPFVELALHPGLSPAGQVQVLIPGAFMSVTLTMLALGILSTGAGAVIGKACGAILLVPLVTLSWHVLARSIRSSLLLLAPSVGISLLKLLTGGLVVSAFILAAFGTLPLLTYGPTTNLYQPVSVLNKRTPNRGRTAPTTGTVQSATFNSPALGGIKRTFEIYLPPSYFVAPQRHYPTFYLLHGSPGGPDDWFQAAHAATTADALIATGKMRETILIGFDGNGPIYRFSEWANSSDGRQRMEDALTQDLVPFIDTHYRTLAGAANRAIGGLSMGGFGAVNSALHHPKMFRAVMSLGGYFQAEGLVFGSGAGTAAYHRLNSPSLLLQTPMGKKSASRITFVIGVGTTDGRYYREGMAFYHQLLITGIHANLLIGTGGHAWSLWAKQLGEALTFLEPALSGSPGAMAPAGEPPFLHRRNTGHRGIPFADHHW
jgi:enterochelin esterase-like enzyme